MPLAPKVLAERPGFGRYGPDVPLTRSVLIKPSRRLYNASRISIDGSRKAVKLAVVGGENGEVELREVARDGVRRGVDHMDAYSARIHWWSPIRRMITDGYYPLAAADPEGVWDDF